jgi:hypothetical protein
MNNSQINCQDVKTGILSRHPRSTGKRGQEVKQLGRAVDFHTHLGEK